jgi:hypothetical protein
MVTKYLFNIPAIASPVDVQLSVFLGGDMRYRNRKLATVYLRENGIPCGGDLLAQLAVAGEGPPFRYWGRQTIYTEDDLDAWIESKLCSHRKALWPPLPSRPHRKADEPIDESLLSPPTRSARKNRPRKKPALSAEERA